MIKAINLHKTVEHQLSFDPDFGTDAATTFILGALDSRVMSIIKDKATAIPVSAFSNAENAVASLNVNQTNLDIVIFGLKGFKNFQDHDGKQIEFKTTQTVLGNKTYTTVLSSIVEMLPEEAISELAGVIMDINNVSETERKNSEE